MQTQALKLNNVIFSDFKPRRAGEYISLNENSNSQSFYKSKKRNILWGSLLVLAFGGVLFFANKYKKSKILKQFTSKASEASKSSLVPVEKLTKDFDWPFHIKPDKYEQWHFTSEKFFKKFIELHKNISELVRKTKLYDYELFDMKILQELASNGDKSVLNLSKAIREMTNVDILKEIKIYRFIGQSELDVIRAKKPFLSKNYSGYNYFSLNPNQGYSVLKFDYRVTFKNTDNMAKNLSPFHESQYKATMQVPYTYSDVEKVEKIVKGKWQSVDF